MNSAPTSGCFLTVGDHGLQIAELGAAVVAHALEAVGQHLFFQHQGRYAVGQLNFAAGTRLHLCQMMENPRAQDIAADHGQIGRGVHGTGLLHYGTDRTRFFTIGLDDAVLARVLARHFVHTEHRALVLLVHLRHLPEHRRLAVDQVIGQDYGERLVVDHRLGAQHRVSQAQRLRLADVDAVDVLGDDALHQFEQVQFAARREFGFHLVGLVEMVLDAALVAAGDEYHVGDARCHRLFHRVLNQRLVDHRHHFLRAGLGRRQEAAAHARHRKYTFAHAFH